MGGDVDDGVGLRERLMRHLDGVAGIMVDGLVQHEPQDPSTASHRHSDVALLLKQVVQCDPLST